MSVPEKTWDEMTLDEQIETIVELLRYHEVEAAAPKWFRKFENNKYLGSPTKAQIQYEEEVIRLEGMGLISTTDTMLEHAKRIIALPAIERAEAIQQYAKEAAARHV